MYDHEETEAIIDICDAIAIWALGMAVFCTAFAILSWLI